MKAFLVAAYRGLQDRVVPERHMVRRFIAAHLPAVASPGGWCLDIGAGASPFAAALQAAAPGLDYAAVDVIANDTTDIIADARALPFAEGSAAVVCFFQVLTHVTDPRQALAEAHRVLKPGGCLVISYPTLCPEGRSRDLWRWTRPGMALLLAQAGFDGVADRPQGGFLSFALATLAMIPGRMLIRHRRGWRSGRGVGDAVRLGLAFLLALPFHLLGFLAWMVDSFWDRSPAFYIGGMVLARRRDRVI